MRSTYQSAMVQVFRDEGGYTNDPRDPGGPTNWGITLGDARHYWKADATAEDVRNMPKSVASEIYEKHYALPLHYDDLPAGVDYAVLDYGINSGISRSAKVLQRLVGVPADGSIGPITLQAVSKFKPADLVNKIYDERLRFLQGLSTWSHFGKGWGARCATGRRLALQLVSKPAVPSSVNHATTAVVAGSAGAVVAAHSTTHFWPILVGIVGIAVVIGLIVHYFNTRKVTTNVVENSSNVGGGQVEQVRGLGVEPNAGT